ncbi:hypothetical protein Trydic_g3300 [Trypoxylus dichotomus]
MIEFPFLVIGKSKRTRCFKGVKTLPVDYESNKEAWVTREILKEWLKKVDDVMKSKGRKILLIISNSFSLHRLTNTCKYERQLFACQYHNYSRWIRPSNEELEKLMSCETIMPTFEEFIGINDDVAVTGEHTDDNIVEDYVTTSTDRNDTEDKANQANASLGTEEKLFPQKQKAINYLKTDYKFF